MELKSPIGLLSIRDRTGKLLQTAAFEYYQNGLDYLNSFAQSRKWIELAPGMFATPTKHVVQVELMIPNGIDLTKLGYLEREEDDQKGQEDQEPAQS